MGILLFAALCCIYPSIKLTATAPAAIKGIKGIEGLREKGFLRRMIKSMPRKHAMLMAIYQCHSPSTRPIMHEYHTSANPNFLFEIKKARRKTDKPVNAPTIDVQKRVYEIALRMKNKGKAMIKATRGNVPVLISKKVIATENKIKRDLDITSSAIRV